MRFEGLNHSHSERLLAFELENRSFFENAISPREEGFYSLRGVSGHIDELIALQNQSSAFSFVLVEDERIIARANLKNIEFNRSAEIGYRVGEKDSGKGIGFLCVQHLVKLGRSLKLNSIYALVMDNNPASEKILSKNGFTLDVSLPARFSHQGKVLDGFKYSLNLG